MTDLKPAPGVSWLKLDAPWYAVVRRGGFGYVVNMTNGGMEELGSHWRLTRWGAERLGRRLAARRNRMRKSWRVP